ncbi:hypothetical protein [Mycobacterium sp. 852014-50255_SCH5639931]|uniref:hypothetical protein n=1 Tax=Mycobacterium sp. 852014-50255_SCH5639931 TaxID=1834112 RepID=UPI0007FE97AE|nr:hypothetical protein [Mycobacterium sp. 852014-50255_SCH5639931]OBB65843.1 hypothetical protein A5758_16075 [Mycobacterium sp. 852014-50255_SCH5639931]
MTVAPVVIGVLLLGSVLMVIWRGDSARLFPRPHPDAPQLQYVGLTGFESVSHSETGTTDTLREIASTNDLSPDGLRSTG